MGLVSPEDPAAVAEERETLKLAFISALQHLPARQRAALILCEVLRWKATEAAELLETSVASINSALQRARATLDEAGATSSDPVPEMDAANQELLARYVEAFQAYDVDLLTAVIREDAIQSMPPFDLWLEGRDDVLSWFFGPGAACAGSRLIAVESANGLPAFGQYKPSESGSGYDPWALNVVRLGPGRGGGAHVLPGHRAPVPALRASASPRGLADTRDVDLVPPYLPADDRYDRMPYRRCGRSGIQLPALSLGLWQNFGTDRPLEHSRAILRRAFDLGITHFDLANNYGPPYGSAEENFGRLLAQDFRPYRDELIISTKAGYDMWPGPYGEWGSRKYLLASLDQSLERMGLEYVDIFYSHRFDPETPLEETMGALDAAVRQGKALYVGISSYSAGRTREAAEILRALGTPLLIHQPSYSMLNRWIEAELLDALEEDGVGCIAFSPLAQGLLTGKYLNGDPGGLTRPQRGLLLRAAAERREPEPGPGAEPGCRAPRPEPGPTGAGLGPAGSEGHLGADRSLERSAAGGQRGGASPSRLRPRGTGRDRPPCPGGRDQHLGGVESGLTGSTGRASLRPASSIRSVSSRDGPRRTTRDPQRRS